MQVSALVTGNVSAPVKGNTQVSHRWDLLGWESRRIGEGGAFFWFPWWVFSGCDEGLVEEDRLKAACVGSLCREHAVMLVQVKRCDVMEELEMDIGQIRWSLCDVSDYERLTQQHKNDLFPLQAV